MKTVAIVPMKLNNRRLLYQRQAASPLYLVYSLDS